MLAKARLLEARWGFCESFLGRNQAGKLISDSCARNSDQEPVARFIYNFAGAKGCSPNPGSECFRVEKVVGERHRCVIRIIQCHVS